MQVSIVIPVYNALPLATQCVASLFECAAEVSFEVIVVDNGSSPDVEQWLQQQRQLHGNLRSLRYEDPLGFARSVNAGAAVATGDVLIVLNSDTIVTPRWIDELCAALDADPSLGALTPSTNHSGELAQMDFSTIDLTPAKALAARANHPRAPNILYLPQRLTFFCVALKREVWLAFAGLDEAYRVGNFEDDDLCLRLRVAGYRLGVAQHIFVYHHNNATFQSNRIGHGEWMTQNAEVFARHARQSAEDPNAPVPRWPRRSAHDISVLILPDNGGSLDRTLLSLANQTVVDFEIVLPGSAPTRSWIAYVTQGDILYPFHLEALLDAMDRNSAESIFADAWVTVTKEARPHPDAANTIRESPLLSAGWMHHASLHLEHVWEQSIPIHWPRLTWEMQKMPFPAHVPKRKTSKRIYVEVPRKLYRRLIPYETRLEVDRRLREVLGRPRIEPGKLQLQQQLTAQLETSYAKRVDAGKFSNATTLPAILMFNAVSWNSAVQRQHHFARGLAQRGHLVLWIEPQLSPMRNWVTHRPLQQAAPGVHLVRLPAHARDVYNMQWNPAAEGVISAALVQTASVYGIREAVSLVNYPLWEPVAMRLRERRGWKVAADCLDDQRALADIYKTPLYKYEDWLIEGADLLLTSSIVLQERLRPKAAILLHNACDYDLFSSSVSLGPLRHLPRPVIGFFGALADWLDMDLIHAAALRFPDWSFVYIGPHTFSNTTMEAKWLHSIDLPNITALPLMDQRTLAAHLCDFDVCTMPFLDIPVTRSMNAVKLYEYLAAGKSAVSRDLPEIRHLLDDSAAKGLVSLYNKPEGFFHQLQEALKSDSPELRARRKSFAQSNDWSKRIDVLSHSLTQLA